MASIFGHAALALGIGGGLLPKKANRNLLIIGVLCSMMPDIDVVGFGMGIPYESMLGHRGFTHSIIFGAFWALLVVKLFFSKSQIKFWNAFLYLFLCTVSHGVLDAMTTGGKGVGFFIPFDVSRYFFPWRIIRVSPIGVERFFSDTGLQVIYSEFMWIMIPSFVLGVSLYLIQKKSLFKRNSQNLHSK